MTYERFLGMQQREIERYRSQHKELSKTEAALEWVKKYSRAFRLWFRLTKECS